MPENDVTALELLQQSLLESVGLPPDTPWTEELYDQIEAKLMKGLPMVFDEEASRKRIDEHLANLV